MHKLWQILFIFTIMFNASKSYSVENTSVLDRYTVVGIISGIQNQQDIAVIRDHSTHKSITVRLGGMIGADNSLKIIKIARRQVVVEHNGKSFTLKYGSPSIAKNKTVDSKSSSFPKVNYNDFIENSPSTNDDLTVEYYIDEESEPIRIDLEQIDNINRYHLLQKRRYLQKIHSIATKRDESTDLQSKNIISEEEDSASDGLPVEENIDNSYLSEDDDSM
ncbi:MAG: hypothetical protein R3B45_15765 [Bdellovibrionota bacterium]